MATSETPAPLIPERNKYSYKPAQMTSALHNIVNGVRAKLVKITVPDTQHATVKLVHALCTAAHANVWNEDCEKALVEKLPLREHHKAFLSHMFVTMIGTVVARALEQATSACETTLDLLTDRYYVRSIACHDSSKTSTIEATAYAGIMAVHMEKEALRENAMKRQRANRRYGSKQTAEQARACSQDKLYTDTDALTTAMANFGFKHHYENNPHHPEHFADGVMKDMNLLEAIVDGLACIFERNKDHADVQLWLGMYHVNRFKDGNKTLAQTIIDALRMYITAADYKALQDFWTSIFTVMGESIPWSRVMMTECCNHKTDHSVPEHNFGSCFPVEK